MDKSVSTAVVVGFTFLLYHSLSLVSLDSAEPSSASTKQAVAVETCECPWGYSGSSCEVSLLVWAVKSQINHIS